MRRWPSRSSRTTAGRMPGRSMRHWPCRLRSWWDRSRTLTGGRPLGARLSGSPLLGVVGLIPAASQREKYVDLIVGDGRIRKGHCRLGGGEARLDVEHIEDAGATEPQESA